MTPNALRALGGRFGPFRIVLEGFDPCTAVAAHFSLDSAAT
jgi:hypothetical protein